MCLQKVVDFHIYQSYICVCVCERVCVLHFNYYLEFKTYYHKYDLAKIEVLYFITSTNPSASKNSCKIADKLVRTRNNDSFCMFYKHANVDK